MMTLCAVNKRNGLGNALVSTQRSLVIPKISVFLIASDIVAAFNKTDRIIH